jgi:hypothetical protein
MTNKDVAKHVIDILPENSSMDTIIYALYINSKFERGEKEIIEGKGVSNDAAKSRLKK